MAEVKHQVLSCMISYITGQKGSGPTLFHFPLEPSGNFSTCMFGEYVKLSYEGLLQDTYWYINKVRG